MRDLRDAMIMMRFWQKLGYFYVPGCNKGVVADCRICSHHTIHTPTHTTRLILTDLMHVVPRSRRRVMIATYMHTRLQRPWPPR